MARSAVRSSARNSRRQAYPHQGSSTLPRANLVAKIPNRYPFVDRDGRHDGPAQLRQFASVASGTVTLYHASIVGTETVTSSGTATVSVISGGITIGAGTCWEIKDSAGHFWSHCAALSATSVVMWDVGLGDHLIAEDLDEEVVTALCSTTRDLSVGTDWLDRGFTVSDGVLKVNLTSLIPLTSGKLLPAVESGNGCCATTAAGIDFTNFIPNSVFTGPGGASPNYPALWNNAGVDTGISVIPSSFFDGEYAVRFEAVASRPCIYYNFTADKFVVGRRYRLKFYVEEASGTLSGVVAVLRNITSTEPSRNEIYVKAGHVGWVFTDFTVSVGASTPQVRIGVGCSAADTGVLVASRLMCEDITDTSLVRFSDYIKTTTSSPVTLQFPLNDMRKDTISFFGDSNVALQSNGTSNGFTTFLQGINRYNRVYGIGVSGYTSENILSLLQSNQTKTNGIVVIWAGRNDSVLPITDEQSVAALSANIASMVSIITSGKFLVVNVLKGSVDSVATKNRINLFNAMLTDTYGDRVVDAAGYISTLGTGEGQDAIDVANGIPPSSLRIDNIHLSSVGYRLVNNKIKEKMIEKMWIGEDSLPLVPLQYQGPPRNNITRLTGESTVIDPAGTYEFSDTNAWRVVTGWTAGTANFGFNASGVPIQFSGQQLIDAGIGYQLYSGQKGVAGYAIEQDAKSHKKIVKFLRVNTYLDSVLYDPDQDYNW